ncbi:LacI family DNA-binding transcriptional regulator [Paenibacillus sp. FSL M7-1455]|jgi:LacI family transcriptional regulator|uniref:Ribose operon repressor n=1 Tax=Paenibacillus cookii TaxID=157839 RepID=A0ABQ4LRH3_9BACL|nr:LacI family DNA-binding transcriptional regulator [Paenibacillus cookii]KHF35746.1 Catabolite control protein A [Paenibacillus sp. P1XP2]GIO65844.1 ribose operon repressor [Paenibacillus cookii]
MATIRDVAKHAGVSVATVSRVINETGYVHEDTRRKVETAIRELHYTPNEVARSLYKRKSRLIGLLLPDITNPFFPELARGVEDEMQANDFRIIFGNSDENRKKEKDYIQTFVQNNVVGVIASTNHPDNDTYRKLDIPVVFLDRTADNRPSVYSDGREGGRIAAQEMLSRGSRKITVIKGPKHIRPAQDRYQGAIDVLSNEGIAFNVIQTSSYSFTEAGTWAKELFEKHPDTDGVIASNDIVATAVLHEALRLGKKVPDDVQIIGFDDIPLSTLLTPSLTTIRQPAYDMGRAAASLLIQLIENENVDNKTIQMPVTFTERDTTRKVEQHG